MKWSSTIRFSQPLRDVVPCGAGAGASLGRYLEEREQRGYARGVQDGEKRLSQQLLQQRAELLQLQQGVLASLGQTVSQVARETESTLIQLALEVARKMVSEIPITQDMIEANLRAALAQVEEATEFFIQLHPEDLALLQRQSSSVLNAGTGEQKFHFHGSTEVGRGGCLVQTRFGIIDARRETRLETLRQSLEV